MGLQGWGEAGDALNWTQPAPAPPAALHWAQLSPSARLGALRKNRFHKGPKWERGREEHQHKDPEEGWRRRRAGGEGGLEGLQTEQRPTPAAPGTFPEGAEAVERESGRSCCPCCCSLGRAHARAGRLSAKVNPLQKESGGKPG